MYELVVLIKSSAFGISAEKNQELVGQASACLLLTSSSPTKFKPRQAEARPTKIKSPQRFEWHRLQPVEFSPSKA
jgi:hypothetical protein